MARTIEDAVFLIRDHVKWSGCSAHRLLAASTEDAARIARYDESIPVERANRCFLEARVGGPRLAAAARKAERQYRLAAWVLKRIWEGREAFDAAQAKATEDAEEARIAALPRVNCWGR
jgi:hypothetical protein